MEGLWETHTGRALVFYPLALLRLACIWLTEDSA